MITQEEWNTYNKVYKECRLEDLNSTAQIQFDTDLTEEELDKAFDRFEHIYDCDKTENDCLYEAVNYIIKERE